ncbi:hypothetical protein HPB52_007146 [Rhipicephalus sanguineus]|uniref:Mutator-like transposase domain-containing protein n=1 Tax=Rhipicephalus sanguineus TaxID=34632 RepID=A0A9D4PDM3_RHISA|nr:hypothetical protein HPB52_007146 [Rhipicephalus sanguineus]
MQGNRGGAKGFHTEGALTHVFCLVGSAIPVLPSAAPSATCAEQNLVATRIRYAAFLPLALLILPRLLQKGQTRVAILDVATREVASVACVKELYAEFGNAPGNVDVIYDGAWLTRRHRKAGRSAWLIQHAPLCQKNVDCNAGQMEVEAALDLFGRSLEKHKLRYTTMLSDGDSRTFHALTENEVYGYVKEKKKAQGGSLGGKGRLTQQKIKIASYYGYALRSHRNDVPGTQRAVLPTLKHMSSTDKAPKHDLCPEGPDSWCKYQRTVAKKEKPPPHKDSLPVFVSEAPELPMFRRLSDRALLFERAVAKTISRFNQGITKGSIEIAEKLGYSAGYNLVRRSLGKDKNGRRKSQREQLNSNSTKTRLAQGHKPAGDPAYNPGLDCPHANGDNFF